MKRRIRSGLGFFVCLLVLTLSFLSSINFVSTVKAQEPQQNVFFDKQPDWSALWTLFNQHAMWDLEWYNSTSLEWVSIKSDLTIQKIYPKNDTCKITLKFNASQTGNYRLTFAIDARVRNYVNKTAEYQYELDYDDYSIVFDWSDVVSISGLVITHGLKEIEGNEYFWFRMRRDSVPKGAYVEIDPTVAFTTVSVTSVHTCPLDTHTFVIAYHDETNDDFSFQIYDTNGTQILAETDVNTTSGGSLYYTSVGVSAFNSTTFVIGWYDGTDADATFAVYNTAGSLLSGPTDADTDIGIGSHSVQVSCFNSTHFVIGWYDRTDQDATFAIYDSSSNLIAGPIDVDETAGTSGCSVSVSTFNSTTFVIGWHDSADFDDTFAIYNSAGTQIGATIDADATAGSSISVSVSTLNSTHFVIGWYDSTDQDSTFAVYDSTGSLKTGPTDADTTAGSSSYSVQVSALNSTAFVISWRDQVDFDLSFATYLSDGTAVAAQTDIESWPTGDNTPFKFQSPCSQESGTGIKLYNDNWIIAYANTTTQADWKAFMPNGTAWDGTIPAAGETNLAYSTSIVATFTPSKINIWNFNRGGSIPFIYGLLGLPTYMKTISGSVATTFSLGSQKVLSFLTQSLYTLTTLLSSEKSISFRKESTITLASTINSAFSTATLELRNIFGTIIATFTPEQTKTASFLKQSTLPLSFTINGLKTFNFLKQSTVPFTFSIEDFKTVNFLKESTLPLAFTVDGAKTFNFFKQTIFTLNTAIDGVMTHAAIVNLFGIVPVTFNIQGLKSVSFLRESIFTLNTAIDGLMSYTSGTILNLFGIIPITFQLDSTRNYLFTRSGLINLNIFLDMLASGLPSIPITPSIPSEGGNAPAPTTFGLSQYHKAAVGVILIGAVIAVALEANKKVRKKKKMRKPGSSNGKGKRDPNLTPSSYPGRKPRWKHPHPKEENYAY